MNVKIVIPLLCTYLFATTNLFAQQFINGGFEPVTAIAPCKDMDVKVYNHNMGSNWSAGTATTMQIANGTCSAGSPVSGSYFGMLKYAPPSDGNIIVFKLDKPLTPNKSYSFSLSYKIPASMSSVNGGLRFGYTSDSTKADSVAGTTPPISSTAWKKDTITFTPKQAWQYVWIEVAALGGDPFEVDVDDVKMLVTGTDVAGIDEAGALQIVPNPFTGQALLKVNNNVSYPYNVMLYDMTGRVVFERKDNNQDNLIINRPDAGAGMYLLKISDSQQRVYTSKLLVQ